ncbi:GGDEF domain-containing protein [Pseudomonas sp. MM211]|uniref:GGDEF domain-containing protein n=1 Tax=Pseudomonas sp. MM211 TaxID=2866808 RepID=UPI001CED22C5|nr:GGDEF domain-containing protein [Pseudomonas sp. MM211]UCJ18952.1 GGDEF domain-containing protein [Pseudomonas sp. MM211]
MITLTLDQQRTIALLRKGIATTELMAIMSWGAVQFILGASFLSAFTLLPLIILFFLLFAQAYAKSIIAWRFSGLLFVAVFVLSFKILFIKEPYLYTHFSLAFSIICVTGESLLIRKKSDFLIAAILTWAIVFPLTDNLSDSSDYTYILVFFVSSFTLGLVNNRTYWQSLEDTLAGEAHYRMIAETDYLTSIYNRRAFMERLNKFTESKPGGFFLMIDIDNFKKINDSYGHDVGDQVLCAMASYFRAVEGNSVYGRIGGEEFAVFIDTLSEKTALAYAQRLLEIVRNGYSSPVAFTISAGLVPFTKGDQLSEILVRGDRCLYMAKNTGKNKISTTS